MHFRDNVCESVGARARSTGMYKSEVEKKGETDRREIGRGDGGK